jgi:hypothetical protein
MDFWHDKITLNPKIYKIENLLFYATFIDWRLKMTLKIKDYQSNL